MSDDKKPYLDCHYPKSLIQVDKNEKKISELEKHDEQLREIVRKWNQEILSNRENIKTRRKEIAELKETIKLNYDVCGQLDLKRKKEIEELKNLYSHCGHNLQKIIKNREVLREFMESERKVHDLGIEYYNYDHHIIKLDELIKKLSGEKESVATIGELGGYLGEIPHDPLTNSKPEQPSRITKMGEGACSLCKEAEEKLCKNCVSWQDNHCLETLFIIKRCEKEPPEEKPKGKTIICPNCMRQFQFKHKYYKIVSKEDSERLFVILDYEGIWDSLDPEDYKWLKKFKEKCEVGKE